LKGQFSEELSMANKYMKKGSTPLAVKEMQITTTLSFHLIPVRKAVIETANNSKCWQRRGGKGSFTNYW
jgi:hypothetical protein